MALVAFSEEFGLCSRQGSTTIAQLSGGSALGIRLGFGACLIGFCTDHFSWVQPRIEDTVHSWLRWDFAGEQHEQKPMLSGWMQCVFHVYYPVESL